MPNLVGQTIGKYHVIEQIGEGGMAVVYKAYDNRLERYVAIKVIRAGGNADEKFLKRFEREAKALAQLQHPNIVGVIDYGEHDGVPYLVMEYLPGGTLKQYMQKAMPYQEAARILSPVARALEFAHQNHILHRDVKPGNILLTVSGQPMLTDFGIAKIIEGDETVDHLTGTGVGIGTPEYMAPEQWLGKSEKRTDVYALGVVFFKMVTGHCPYTADTPAAIFLKTINDPLPRPRELVPSLPESVEQMIFKALAKKPEDRYESMDAFADALERLTHLGKPVDAQSVSADGRQKMAKAIWIWLGAAGLLAVIAWIIFLSGGFSSAKVGEQPQAQAKVTTFSVTASPSLASITSSVQPSVEIDTVVSEMLNDVQVLSVDSFDSKGSWRSSQEFPESLSVSNGMAKIDGQRNYAGQLIHPDDFTEGMGVVFQFKYTGNMDFSLQLLRGNWAQTNYKEFSANLKKGIYTANEYQGSQFIDLGEMKGDLRIEKDKFYNVLLSVAKDGYFAAKIWDEDDPTLSLFASHQKTDWADQIWSFQLLAEEGSTVYVDNFKVISFSSYTALTTLSKPTQEILTPKKPSSPFFDDFKNETYDGAFDAELWDVAEQDTEPCIIKQEKGEMYFSLAQSARNMGCHLKSKTNWKLSDISQIESRLKLTKGKGDAFSGVEISIASVDSDWWISCHIAKYKNDPPYLNCWTPLWDEPQNPGGVGGSFNRWRTFRMDIDAVTMTFIFYIDDLYYAKYTPPNADTLKDDRYNVNVGVYGEVGTVAEGFVDYVRLIP